MKVEKEWNIIVLIFLLHEDYSALSFTIIFEDS